jgi:hypothetical protein
MTRFRPVPEQMPSEEFQLLESNRNKFSGYMSGNERPLREAAKRSMLGMAKSIGGLAVEIVTEKLNREKAKKLWKREKVEIIAVTMEKVGKL